MKSRERLTRGGAGGGRAVKRETADIDCTACVLLVRQMMKGEAATCEEWRAGPAPRAAVRALCLQRLHQGATSGLRIGHAQYLMDTRNQSLPLTPGPAHPPSDEQQCTPG